MQWPAYYGHIQFDVHHYPWVDLKYVLQSHRDERFLLLYGTALLQHEVVRISTPMVTISSRLVLCPHTTERFLLLYGKAVL